MELNTSSVIGDKFKEALEAGGPTVNTHRAARKRKAIDNHRQGKDNKIAGAIRIVQ